MSDQLSTDLASLRIRRDEKPRGSGGSWLKWTLVVLALGAGGVGIVKVGIPALESRVFKTEVRVTEVARISAAQASIDLTATGYVLPQKYARVGVKVLGKVSKVSVKENDQVKAGQLLFELDPADQQSAVASSRARVLAAEARAKAALAAVTDLKQQWQRDKRLVDSGTIGRATADDLEARMHTQEETARAAEAEARAISAETGALSVQLKNLRVEAPIAGRIVGKPPELGDVLSPSPDGAFQVVDFSSLVVETDVPEARLSLVKPEAPAEITLDAYPDRRIRGAVLEISPRVNRSKATVMVKVRFVDDAKGALPEMAARVSFLAKALDEAQLKEAPKTVLPGSALAERGGTKVVFLLENGHARMVPVTLGPAVGDGFEVKDGVSAGARVVKDPPATLESGMSVKEKVDG